jgi:hypothetical protein
VAERGKASDKPDLTPDAAAPPPGEPPDTIPIYGILGESGIASSVRLYLDRGLSTYYDVPIEGIAAREKVPADQSPLGVDSTLLLVRKGVQLVVHHVDTRTVEEEFLAGDFTSPGSFTPTAAAPAAPAAPGIGPIHPTLGFTCTMLPPACPRGDIVSAPPNCPSVQLCQTQPQFCGPIMSAPPRCPSVQLCHTRPPFCPILSAPPHCPTVQLCPTLPHLCGPVLSAPPHCPSAQVCPTNVQFCHPILSAPPRCPTVQACPTLNAACPPASATPLCPTAGLCPSQVAFCGGGFGGNPGEV